MEISAEKPKLMTNNTSGIDTEIKVNGQRLETVRSFKYLGSVITDEDSKPEILSRIAQTTAALTRLKPVWTEKSISLSSKIRLMRSLVTSIFLYAYESWTITAEFQRRIQSMEMRCYHRILLLHLGAATRTVIISYYITSNFDLCVDATYVVCHQLGLLGTDLHAVGCGGFVKTPAKPSMSSAKRRLVIVLPPMLTVPS